MAKRDEYLANIRRRLSAFMVEIGMGNQVNRMDLNISAEDICCGLLNLIFDWRLENANADKQNYTAIDLIDWDEGVAVQVTSENTSKKIKETIKKLEGQAYVEKIDRLIVLLLREKKDYSSAFESDEFDVEIMDLYTLSEQIEHKSVKKLSEISKYLDDELSSLFDGKPVIDKPKHLLPPVPAQSPSYIAGSRRKELDRIAPILESGDPVFIWGNGGIGKTELAIQLAKKYAPPQGAYFIRCAEPEDKKSETIRETILRADFSGYCFIGKDNENRDAEYRERMDILRTEYPGALLIIDDFERSDKSFVELCAEKSYRELTQLGIKLVFLTRYSVGEKESKVEALPEQQLLTLMRMYCKDKSVTDEKLLSAIRAVDGNTIMVYLMAQMLENGNASALLDIILEKMRENAVQRSEETSNDQSQLINHLRTLFKISGLTEQDRYVMRCATLLPDDGMEYTLFRDCLIDPRLSNVSDYVRELLKEKMVDLYVRQDALPKLVNLGWLSVDNNTLLIHPVVRMVCQMELHPDDATCEEFLTALSNRFDLDREYHAELFAQIAKCFSVAAEQLEDQTGKWSFFAGRYWKKVGNYQKALSYELQMLERREGSSQIDSPKLAASYINVGETYGELADYLHALHYQQKALEILKKADVSNNMDLVSAYLHIGRTYGVLKDHRNALQYKQQALVCCEGIRPLDSVEVADCYDEIGITYGELGDYGKALENGLHALSIREGKLPADHPNIAQSYRNIGKAYSGAGDYAKTLEYMLKATSIAEKVLPPSHPDLAMAYNNVGNVYGDLGEHAKAAEYYQKALLIQKKVLPSNHPNLSESYSNAGYAYTKMGNYVLALEYYENALSIAEKSSSNRTEVESLKKNVDFLRLFTELVQKGISPT